MTAENPKGSWAGGLEQRAHQLLEQGLINAAQAEMLGGFAAEMSRLMGGRAGGGLEVTVTSAIPLSDEDRAAVERSLTARLGKGLAVDYRIDPQILGGLVVRAGDQIIDGSVAGKLEALKKSILEAI